MKLDITPFCDHAFLIWRNMHQVQLKLTDKVYKIQQAEARLKEILGVSNYFREWLLKVVKKFQG